MTKKEKVREKEQEWGDKEKEKNAKEYVQKRTIE